MLPYEVVSTLNQELPSKVEVHVALTVMAPEAHLLVCPDGHVHLKFSPQCPLVASVSMTVNAHVVSLAYSEHADGYKDAALLRKQADRVFAVLHESCPEYRNLRTSVDSFISLWISLTERGAMQVDLFVRQHDDNEASAHDVMH